MSTDIFFSIVIPVYNRAFIVTDTITSILAQEDEAFELLIIDDGSEDDLEQRLKALYTDSRLLYIRQSNQERGYSRNHGYRLAKGTHVVFIDSDDVVTPGFLKALKKAIIEDQQAQLFSWYYNFFNETTTFDADIMKLNKGYHGIDTLLRGNPFACNICIDKTFVAWTLFVEDRHYAAMEDWIFLVQNVRSHSIKLIDFVGVSMREHDGRSMRMPYEQITTKRLAAMAYILQHVSLSEEQKKILSGFSYQFCSIHCYIDHARAQALRYWIKAYQQLGLNRLHVFLLIKIIVGSSIINQLKRVLR